MGLGALVTLRASVLGVSVVCLGAVIARLHELLSSCSGLLRLIGPRCSLLRHSTAVLLVFSVSSPASLQSLLGAGLPAARRGAAAAESAAAAQAALNAIVTGPVARAQSAKDAVYWMYGVDASASASAAAAASPEHGAAAPGSSAAAEGQRVDAEAAQQAAVGAGVRWGGIVRLGRDTPPFNPGVLAALLQSSVAPPT